MYNPATRLLSVLELLQSRAQVSGLELAQVLEVEERSVRRYIMLLRDMGIPIEGERGRHGGYSLRPGFRLPPLMFNADEITAVMMGLMLMQALGSSSQLAVESANAKIQRVLPQELRQRTEAVRGSVLLEEIQLGTYMVSSDSIMTFSLAAHEGKCLQITYISADGYATQRLIAPYGVVLHARTWYVPAYCYLREDVRLFRLDRVREFALSDQIFTRPADFEPRQFVLDSLAHMPGIYQFEIIFHAPLLTVQTIIPPSLAILENHGDETLMRCYSDDPFWLARYLISTELSFTVQENDELRDALRVLSDEILGSIQKGSLPTAYFFTER